MICSECHKKIRDRQYFNIDGKAVCYQCLFGDVRPVSIYPIGCVQSIQPDGNSIIRLYPSQKRFMYRLCKESEICVVYFLHKIDSILTVFNRGRNSEGKKVGVFASHTPCRTSRIAITQVRLLSVSGLDLKVKGLDAFQDSPVLDIKSVAKHKSND